MKELFTISILFLFSIAANAQINEGGIPLSFSEIGNISARQYIPQETLPSPNIQALVAEDSKVINKPNHLFRIGALMPADISYPGSGVMTTLNDGRKVWKAQVKIPNSAAIGIYYDKIHLPGGVKYYLYNENEKQVLGAYTSAEVPEDGQWANEKVQGEVVNLELDLDADVDPSAIALHINDAAVFYRSVKYLDKYADRGGLLSAARKPILDYDSSSPCEVNAICEGTTFAAQRKATVKIEYVSGGFVYGASGIIVNNTRQDCTPYMLTASHVEPTNSTSNTTFRNWVFYFNYETPDCKYTGPQPDYSQTITGGTFKARSSYDSSSDKIAGDFILLQLLSAIPATYGAYAVGWDRTGDIPTAQCVSFHHPSGDVMKVALSQTVSPLGNFNNGEIDSHWEVNWATGGTEEGSSGGGLFDPNGRLIGDLSGGFVFSPVCLTKNANGDVMADYAEYSKFYLNWLYTFESPSSSATRLKDWLDPDNLGDTVLDAISCGTTYVNTQKKSINTISVFPNPTNGIAYVNLNFDHPTEVKIDVLNTIGVECLQLDLQSVNSGQYKLDLSNKPTGLYLVRISANNYVYTHKIMLVK